MISLARAPAAKSGLVWAGLLVSALFTYIAVRDVRFSEVWEALQASNYWWLLPALALLAIAILVRAVRWRFLFARETRPPIAAVMRAMLVGYFFNNILPARAGEAARVVALNQSAGTSRAEATATVVIERTYDVLSLLVLLFVTLPWLPHVTWVHAAAVLAIALTAGLAVAIALLAVYGERPLRVALRPLARLPFLSSERVEAAASNLAHGLAAIRRPRLALAGFLWTTLSWLLLGLSFWLVMLGFDLELSPVAGLLVQIAVGLAMILPSSPAAVGVFEAATLVALGAYGISDSRALSYALVLHVLNFLPYIVVGSLVLHRHAVAVGRR